MINLLVVIAIVLGIVAISTVGKLSNLLNDIKGKKPGEMSESDNKLNAIGFLVFLIVFFGLFVWQIVAWKDLMLPESASAHGFDTDNLLNWTWAVILIPFVICQFLLFIFCIKYYYKKDRKATFFPHNNKLELAWTIVPTIVLTALIIYGLKTWDKIMMSDRTDADVKIELYGKQFEWIARYAGKDGKFGRANVRLIEGVNAMGIDSLDANSWDDKVVSLPKEFHLPVGKKVDFQFRSQDIIHSAYMPHFRAQMNCVPGMVTNFNFIPTKTTEEMRKDPFIIKKMKNINKIRASKKQEPVEFDYVLMCNKICGSAHYNMKMKIVVESEADYNKWLAEKESFKAASL